MNRHFNVMKFYIKSKRQTKLYKIILKEITLIFFFFQFNLIDFYVKIHAELILIRLTQKLKY